jgi:peptidyl-prolyl cis-trans isomerase B (cyclophilin B)
MQRIFSALIFGLTVFAALSAAQTTPKKDEAAKPPQTPKKANSRPAESAAPKEPFEKASVETMRSQCVRFETEKGIIEIEMFPESAPESVRNFLNLISIGAFDSTTFSRVVPGFIIQGGSVGTRQPIRPELFARARKTVPDEPSQIKHERGILSMARGDEPNSASSHFFILVDAAPHLDGKFAAFGRVTNGMETVDAINKMPVEGDKPTNPVRLTRAEVFTCAAAK